MPDLRLNEIRLPELHLPEMSRDDIVQAVNDKRRDINDKARDIDLSRFDPRRIELPEVDLSKIDVQKAVTEAAQSAGIARRDRMPRLPFVIGGLVTMALVAFAVITNPRIKPRLDDMARKAKASFDERRARWDADHDADLEPRAFDAAVAVPVESSAFSDSAPAGSPFDGPADLPAGFGADVYHDGPVEEAAKA